MNELLLSVRTAIKEKLYTTSSVYISALHYDFRRSQLIVQSSVNRLFIISEHSFNGSLINGRLFSSFDGETDGLKEAVQYFDELVAKSNEKQYRDIYHDPEHAYMDSYAYEAAGVFLNANLEDVFKIIKDKDLDPLEVFDRFKYDGEGSSILEVIKELSE